MFSNQLSKFVPFNDFFIGMKLGARSFHPGVPGAIQRRRYRTHSPHGFFDCVGKPIILELPERFHRNFNVDRNTFVASLYPPFECRQYSTIRQCLVNPMFT